MADENENNLVQRREDRRTLAKMRNKLATSGNLVRHDAIRRKQGSKKSLRIWPFALATGIVLIALNLALRTQQDGILKLLGVERTIKPSIAPPAGASLDEQARFWAYAVYDLRKLKSNFRIPNGAVIDNAAARENLEILLADNLGAEVRKEIFEMDQKAPKPRIGKRIGAGRHKAARRPVRR
jgi:hypothetical protein